MNAAEVMELAHVLIDSWAGSAPPLIHPPTLVIDEDKSPSGITRVPYSGGSGVNGARSEKVLEINAATGSGSCLVVDLTWLPEYRKHSGTHVLWVEDMTDALPEPDLVASILWGRLMQYMSSSLLENFGTDLLPHLVLLTLPRAA